MPITRILSPALAITAAAVALTASAASGATITVTEAATDVRVPVGVVSPTAPAALVYFGGMRSPEGKARGHFMGYEDLPDGGTSPAANSTKVFAFGSGARIVAQQPKAVRVRAGMSLPLAGGTGQYLGAQGTEVTSRRNGTYTHTITYTLPAKGAPRTVLNETIRYGTPQIIARGGAGDVGNGRNLSATLTNAAGEPDGTYQVNSVLEYTYGGGDYQWFVGDGTFTFADGSTLHAVGPFQRATGTAPGVLAPAPRAVNNGTGRFTGMRGQVVLSPNADGTTNAAFTLVR